MSRLAWFSSMAALVAACSGGGGQSATDVPAQPDSGDAPPDVRIDVQPDGPDVQPDTGVETQDGSALDLEEAAEVPPPPDCLTPYQGMEVKTEVKLCGGKFTLDDPDGKGAIRIAADGVTLACDKTEIVRPYLSKAGDPVKTAGISVAGRKSVTITGCKVGGFHQGLRVSDSSGITVKDNDFSKNFDDPSQEWVFDKVQGGGMRFERVDGGLIQGNLLGWNWNGIELRSSKAVEVRDNDAGHTSNTGILMIDSHLNVIDGNDFSWAVRGGLNYPDNWYGVDTRDSAGILIDGGSSHNQVSNNDATYGGDGIFIRSVLGPCPTFNVVAGNDASFSPHNAIENWCDENDFIQNQASDSHYGLWLGGGDFMVVSDNKVERNKVDGISVQIGEDRHNLFERNTIRESGRCGMLISGREYQAWQGLDNWSDKLANASHIVIQRNIFEKNGAYDVFMSSVRGVHLMSNCRPADGTPSVKSGDEVLDVFASGTCPAPAAEAPVPVLGPVQAEAGKTVKLDASGSVSPDGSPLEYYWLVQTGAAKLVPPAMPQPVLAGAGAAKMDVTFVTPGIFDVDVTVATKDLAALASTTVFVPPAGEDLAEGNAAEWVTGCQGNCGGTKVTDDAEYRVAGETSIRVDTNAPYDFWVGPKKGKWNLSKDGVVHMFIRCHNPNPNGWQGNFPALELKDDAGKTRVIAPEANLLGGAEGQWIYVAIPVSGGPGWKMDEKGANLSKTVTIAVHMDTWDWSPYTVWVDGFVIKW